MYIYYIRFFTFIRNNIFLQYDLHIFLQMQRFTSKTYMPNTYCTYIQSLKVRVHQGACHFPFPNGLKTAQNVATAQPGPSCPMSIAEQLHTFDDWDPPGSLDEFSYRDVSRVRWDEDVTHNNIFFWGG